MDIDLKKEWARLYDDKFPNNNVVKFDEETGGDFSLFKKDV